MYPGLSNAYFLLGIGYEDTTLLDSQISPLLVICA